MKDLASLLLMTHSYRPREYDSEDGPWDPITGATSALMGTIGSLMMGVADFPIEIFRAVQGRSAENSNAKDGLGRTEASGIARARPTSTHLSSNIGSGADGVQSDTEISARPSDISALGHHDPLITDIPGRVPSPNTGLQSNAIRDQARDPLRDILELTQQLSEGEFSKVPSGKSSDTILPSQHSSQPATDQPIRQISFETALGAGKGVGRMVGAGLKSPMDFTLGLAKGFHNAPKLYGDSSVRKTEKITGLQSGLKVAGKVYSPVSYR